MRVLLDECLPHDLASLISGHEVRTVVAAGWSGKEDPEILELARGQYDVLVTIDRLLVRQNVIPPDLSVITIWTTANRLASLRPLVPSLLQALRRIRPGERILLEG